MRFMALTVSSSREDVAHMMNAGVDGYITKTTMGNALPDLIIQTDAGLRPVSSDVAGHLLWTLTEGISVGSSIARLTPREREVVNLIARGYTYREGRSQAWGSRQDVGKTHGQHLRQTLDSQPSRPYGHCLRRGICQPGRFPLNSVGGPSSSYSPPLPESLSSRWCMSSRVGYTPAGFTPKP